MDSNKKLSQIILQEADCADFEFILAEAKERLKSTVDIADNLISRSMTIFSFSIAALTTSLGYVFTHFELQPNTVVLSGICFLLWFVCSLLRSNIIPNEYFAIGSDPETIAVDGMFSELDGKRPKFYLLAHLIESYNERIVINRKQNEEKASTLESVMFWIYMIPFCSFLLYLLFFFFVDPVRH